MRPIWRHLRGLGGIGSGVGFWRVSRGAPGVKERSKLVVKRGFGAPPTSNPTMANGISSQLQIGIWHLRQDSI